MKKLTRESTGKNGRQIQKQSLDVALKTTVGVGFYRIYRDCIGGQWFVEGIFD